MVKRGELAKCVHTNGMAIGTTQKPCDIAVNFYGRYNKFRYVRDHNMLNMNISF